MTLVGLSSFTPHWKMWKRGKRRDHRTMEYPREGPMRITETKLIKMDLLGCEGPITTILVTNTLTAELGSPSIPWQPALGE